MAQITQVGPELYHVPRGHQKSEWRVPARYTPQTVLGTGVYGTVVKAYDNEAQRHVAIKKINRDKLCQNASEALRALREIAVLRRLRHPNVMAVLDAFEPAVGDDGMIQSLYVVYEFGGCSLTSFLDKSSAAYSGYFSEGQLRDIMKQLFAGLGYMHMCHVMHRDIKPDNILIEHHELAVSTFSSKGFAYSGTVHPPFSGNVVWKRMCPEGFSLQCEYVVVPSEDGHFHLALASDAHRTAIAPTQLPLSFPFTLVSVAVRVRIADFGLARECNESDAVDSPEASPKFKMEDSLEKVSQRRTEHTTVLSDALRSTSHDLAEAEEAVDEELFDSDDVDSNPPPFTRRVSGGVVTLEYRALEVFVSGGYYSFGVDVWSIACIMAELMQCYCIACKSEKHEVVHPVALFHATSAPDIQSTKSNLEFLRCRDIFHRMFKVTGSPTEEQAEYMLRMMPKQSVKSGAYEKWKQILAYHVANPQPRCDFNAMFEFCSEACCSLLSDMLQIDDRKRATAAHCFRHPFIQPSPPVLGVSDMIERSHLEASIGLICKLHLPRADPEDSEAMLKIMRCILEEVQAIRSAASSS